MKNFKILAFLTAGVLAAGLLTSCASHHAKKKSCPLCSQSAVTNAPATTPMAPVPAPLSKDQRLADLLQQYEANQITPEQYHTQRAAIIAEP